VVDNGSTDGTCRIAESFGARVLRDPEKTVSGLRNLGAVHAAGDILAFVDADCVVTRDWLTNAAPYFDRTDVVLWGSPPEIPEDATWVQKAWYLVRQKEHPVEPVPWLESMNLFVRKNQFNQVNGFDESLITCEDVDFSYRMSKLGTIMADRSIRVLHLGEAATVRIFLKKEIWRGKGNFKGMMKHGITSGELPSLAVPVYFALFLPALVIAALWTPSFPLAILTGCALFFPGIFILFKVRRKKADVTVKARLFFLGYVYFLARTLAVFPFGNDR
jgi:glycosyltransferase involved in cell wall biosynthesis